MKERIYTPHSIFCAIPLGETDLDGTTVLHRMSELLLYMSGLVRPGHGRFMVSAPVNNNRAKARESLVEMALEEGADWIFWLDSDVLPPPEALITLLARQMDICAGLCVTKSDIPWPLILKRGQWGPVRDWTPGDLVECDGTHLGCTLMRTEIFKTLERPWFVEGYEAREGKDERHIADSYTCTEDLPLMYRAKDAGFNCCVDTSLICKHVDWRTNVRYWWDKEKNAPMFAAPGGRKYVFYNGDQQLEYQRERDAKGVK